MSGVVDSIQAIDALGQINGAMKDSQYLAAIDLCLSALDGEADQKKQKHVLRLMCKSALEHLLDSARENDRALEAIFHAELALSSRRFIAVALLRALTANAGLFVEAELRNKTFLLFDKSLPDVYKAAQIEPKQQTHEKEVALKAFVRQAELDLQDVLRPLERLVDASPGSLSPSKADISKLLKKYGAILTPFLQKDLLGTAIEHLFDSAQEFLEADEASALHAFERARSLFMAYEAQAREVRTTYSNQLCARLAVTLSTLCQKRFDQSGAGKPAKLLARASEKRYPLHIVGRTVSLGFILENVGPGYAHELSCKVEPESSVSITKPELFLGDLRVGTMAVEFPATLLRAAPFVLVEFTWSWINFDGTLGSDSTLCELQAQPTAIDWERLSVEEPYILDAVTSEEHLVGRTEVLAQLTAKANAASVGSACIWGQRRIGKTSIAKTLKSRLSSEGHGKVTVLFLEAGEYNHEDAKRTIEQLGDKICNQVISSDNRFKGVKKPAFDGALSPISGFFDEVKTIAPESKFVIILDEFDFVPIDLYRRGATGETFFATIRSLSQKGFIGFVLVGGERMRYLFNCQGQALNKFQMIRVDYFDRSKHWADFQELITRPTRQWLQFSDSANLCIYGQAAGNPYYTVLICRSLFQLMVSRRDSHVTEKEAQEAIGMAVAEASIVNFQHFWDDGIVETGAAAEEISMRRRYVLLSLAEAVAQRNGASRVEIALAARRYNVEAQSVENELSDLIQRDVLIENGNIVSCKVPLFSRWLRTVGPRQISTTYTEAEALRLYRESEERASIRADEITRLIGKWGPFKGRSVSTDDVRAWLDQFGKKSDQRLMFKLLDNVRFYSEDQVRGYMSVAHGIVTRGLVDRVLIKQVKRWQGVLLSYLDGPGKSGARFARLYVDENSLYKENIVEKGLLKDTISHRDDVQALVIRG